jgi:hypothetical protein
MRDLGEMGQSTFTLWCAEVGLIANPSYIDKTGWDYFVEFPYSIDPRKSADMQVSPIECKIQVKATEKTNRKISIKISNLMRFVSAPMPCFFIFIEFDVTQTVQNVFLVHMDNDLISKVLKRIREIDQSDKDNDFNKRTMTIHYGDEHRLPNTNGVSLKKAIESYVEDGMEEYVKKKQAFVKSAGFDDAYGFINFTIESEENLKKLIDVSLGIAKEAELDSFQAVESRFGIKAKKPLVHTDSGRLQMPDLKPTTSGVIRFKENKFSPGLSFQCNLFNSPFNTLLPEKLVKLRIEGDFFDIRFQPFIGNASYSFTIGGVQMEIIKLRDVIKLLSMFNIAGKHLFTELDCEGFPKLRFKIGINESKRSYNKEIEVMESAVHLAAFFDLNHEALATLHDLLKHSSRINELSSFLKCDPTQIKMVFRVKDNALSPLKETACMSCLSCPLGTHTVGVIFSAVGNAVFTDEHEYMLIPNRINIDRKITVRADMNIEKNELIEEFEQAEKFYENDNIEIVRIFE